MILAPRQRTHMPYLFFVELNPLLKMSSKNGSGDSFIIIYGKSIRKKEWTLFSRLNSPSKRMTTEIFGCQPNFASPRMRLPQEFVCCWVKYVSCDSHSLSQAYLHHTCGGHILRHNPRRRQAGGALNQTASTSPPPSFFAGVFFVR